MPGLPLRLNEHRDVPFHVCNPLPTRVFSWLQTWPFMVAGKPESDLKEVVNTNRLCGPTAS